MSVRSECHVLDVDTAIQCTGVTALTSLSHSPLTHRDEVLTFRHYIQTAEELIAFNPRKNPFNPWVAIHAPLALRHAPG